MGSIVRKNVCLDSGLIEEVNRIAKAKGGRRRGYSFSSELSQALKEYVQRQTVQREEAASAPVWARLLDERLERLEDWLRPGVWGGATHSAMATLMLLELLCGKRIDPKEAKAHFDLLRGRAWKIVRRDPAAPARGQTSEED